MVAARFPGVLLVLLLVSCQSTTSPAPAAPVPSSQKLLTAFGFSQPPAPGWINQTGRTVTVFVPEGTDLVSLVPTTAFVGKSLSPAPGTAVDFSAPVDFTVTAEDGTTQTYSVTVLADAPRASGPRPIGLNIAQVRDWSTELAFTDLFLQSREWVSFYDGGPWDAGVKVPLNENGWPQQIPYDDGTHRLKVRTLMLTDISGSYPKGNYRLTAEGKGKITVSGAAGILTTPLNTLVSVTGDYGVTLTIEESDPADPVRNIRFVLPAYADQSPRQTFTEEFLTLVRKFGTVRYMDFLRTCGNPVKTWAERSMPTDARQSTDKGVAWEYVVELANTTGTDAWINIPGGADDGYLTSLADLLGKTLDPNRKLYVEYSNELWNTIMVQQQADALAGAQHLGYSGDNAEKITKYTAHRSADIFRVFGTVFGSSPRLVRVLSGFSLNSWLNERLLTYFHDPVYNPDAVPLDALGIGNYFGYSVANDVYPTYQGGSDVTDVILDRLRLSLLAPGGVVNQELLPSLALAQKYGLKLLAYEAGTHLAPFGAAQGDAAYVNRLLSAHRDDRFYPLFRLQLRAWYTQGGGDLLCWYSSAGKYGKYGGWGLIEDYTQTTSNRLRALQDEVFSYNAFGPNRN